MISTRMNLNNLLNSEFTRKILYNERDIYPIKADIIAVGNKVVVINWNNVSSIILEFKAITNWIIFNNKTKAHK